MNLTSGLRGTPESSGFNNSLTIVKEEKTEDLTPPNSPLDLSVRNTGRTPPLQDKNAEKGPYFGVDLSQQNMVSSTALSPRSMSSPEHLYQLSSSYRHYEELPTQLAPVAKSKITRPFKAYPSNPITLSIESGPLNESPNLQFLKFRSEMLHHLQNQYNGATNKNMRRTANTSQSAQNSDPSYREKRKKNNEAAKRSRDARRAKEDEIAIRCAFLEQEHIRLKQENFQTKQENAELKLRLATLENELRRMQGSLFR